VLPAFAFREHCVPFFVIAWQRPDSTARSEKFVFAERLLDDWDDAAVSAGTGGRQILHG
jgi:hypothetical protein